MKSLLLAGALLIAAGNIAFAQGYWVTGNRASGKCEIVSSTGQSIVWCTGVAGTSAVSPSWRARRYANARRNHPSRRRSRTKRKTDDLSLKPEDQCTALLPRAIPSSPTAA